MPFELMWKIQWEISGLLRAFGTRAFGMRAFRMRAFGMRAFAMRKMTQKALRTRGLGIGSHGTVEFAFQRVL